MQIQQLIIKNKPYHLLLNDKVYLNFNKNIGKL